MKAWTFAQLFAMMSCSILWNKYYLSHSEVQNLAFFAFFTFFFVSESVLPLITYDIITKKNDTYICNFLCSFRLWSLFNCNCLWFYTIDIFQFLAKCPQKCVPFRDMALLQKLMSPFSICLAQLKQGYAPAVPSIHLHLLL